RQACLQECAAQGCAGFDQELADGRISLPAALTLLAERGIGELLVEAGATLCGAFLQAGLADEIVLYQAGKILGGNARSLFDLPENPAALQQPASWQTRSVTILDGGDLKQVLRKKEAV
ncbi:RibD family protein, partial [Neisseria elongata]|uniref:RibD family protein n=1 Tax=Neisseria elongata TaxID=495 RepID=UPI001F378A66